MARKVLGFGGALTVAGVASVILTTAERLLLGHYRSTTVVAYYAVAARLGGLLTLTPTALVQPIFPALVTLHGRDDAAGARRLYRQALQGLFLTLTPALVLLAFIAAPFLSLWAGHAYGTHSAVPFFILLGGVWFNAVAWLPATYLTAVHNPKVIAAIHLSELIPYVGAAALLTSKFGAVGAAVVWTGRVVVDAVIFTVVANRALGAAVSPLSERAVRALVAPLLLGALAFALARVTSGLPARAGCAAGLLVLYCPIVWSLVLTAGERASLQSLAATVAPLQRLRASH